MIVRLVREVIEPGGNGPLNGMWALQNALMWHGLPNWLKIGGELQDDEIAWFWCWKDRDEAAAWADAGQPFVHGPNIFFAKNSEPCALPVEQKLASAASCKLIFTDGEWYADLIRSHLRPPCVAPVVVWPYPIEPKPKGPLPAKHSLLIYAKAGFHEATIEKLQSTFHSTVVMRYGTHKREELAELARQCECCVYLSNPDRGPLGLAEILLAGCPTVGVRTGATWIEPRHTGCFCDQLSASSITAAVDSLYSWGIRREGVRARALELFNTSRIVEKVLKALDQVRQSLIRA